jgi:hypothetical protein
MKQPKASWFALTEPANQPACAFEKKGEPKRTKGKKPCYSRQMGRADCKVCHREDREEIEELAVTDGPRAAGRAAGCSHNAVMRHMAKHTSGVVLERPVFEAVAPKQKVPKPKPSPKPLPVIPVPSAIVAPYKRRFPRVAALVTMQERRHYLAELFRQGRFHGFRTTGHLSLLWDDLGPMEFSELVSRVAIEANFRRGSEQARRVALLSKAENALKKATDAGEWSVVARLFETLARLDVPVGVDLLTALASTQAWPLVAKELQAKFPEAAEMVLGTLVAEEARRRQVSAPVLVEADQAGE